jgi:hypothetical protein
MIESSGCRIRTSTRGVVDIRFRNYQIKQGVDVVLAPLKHLLLIMDNTNDYEGLTINDACVSTTFEGADYVFGSKCNSNDIVDDDILICNFIFYMFNS